MQKKELSVLMLGGGKRVSVATLLMDAGKRLGFDDVKIYSHELSAEQPIACVGEVLCGGRYNDPATVDELIGVVKRLDIDIVLAFVDPAISVVAALKSRLDSEQGMGRAFIPVSEQEITDVLFDKVRSADAFARVGIPIPKTYCAEDVQFPCILKPRRGSASKGIVVAHTAEDFAQVEQKDNYLIQEYIANAEECTVDCYVGMLDGEVKCTVPRLRLETAGGEVVRTRTFRDTELMEHCRRVLEQLSLRGPVTLQWLREKGSQEQWRLMEINPRLGGGVVCSICSGADIAEMIVRESLGQTAHPVSDWRDGALMTRYMKEVMF